MTDRTQSLADIQPEIKPRTKKGPGLAHILLEGRAFIALLVIIAVFSSLSPNYFSGANFLTMASHVAIFGLLHARAGGSMCRFHDAGDQY